MIRDEGRPIVNDKLLAYSYIMTHEGYPCVSGKIITTPVWPWARRLTVSTPLSASTSVMRAAERRHCGWMTGFISCSAMDMGINRGWLCVEQSPGLLEWGLGDHSVAECGIPPVAWWSESDPGECL